MYRVPKNDLDTSDEDEYTEDDEVVKKDTDESTEEDEVVVKKTKDSDKEYASAEETIPSPKSKSLMDEYDRLCSIIEDIYNEHSDGWYNNRKDSIRDQHIWLESLVNRLDEYEPKLERIMNKMNRKGLDTSRGYSLL